MYMLIFSFISAFSVLAVRFCIEDVCIRRARHYLNSFCTLGMFSSVSQIDELPLCCRIPVLRGFFGDTFSFYVVLNLYCGLVVSCPMLFDSKRLLIVRRAVVFVSRSLYLSDPRLQYQFYLHHFHICLVAYAIYTMIDVLYVLST